MCKMNIDITQFTSDTESENEECDESIITLMFHNPFTCMIAGPSQSGKTCLTSRIIKNSHWLYSEKPNGVFYFYNKVKPTDAYLRSCGAVFIEGMPDMKWLQNMHAKQGDNMTVVIDDQAMHIGEDQAELFTVGCSRFNANIIFITQNLYMSNRKGASTLSKNCFYLFIMRNPRELGTLRTFFSQQPENTQDLMQYATEACARPYSYIFINSHQKTNPAHRHMTNLFGENAKLRFPKLVRFN